MSEDQKKQLKKLSFIGILLIFTLLISCNKKEPKNDLATKENFNPEKELLSINNDIKNNNLKTIIGEMNHMTYYIKDGCFVKLEIGGTTIFEDYYFNGKNVFAYEFTIVDKEKAIICKSIFYFNNLKIIKEKYWWGEDDKHLKLTNESILKQFNITKNDILYQYKEILNKNFVGAFTINDLLKDELVTTDQYDDILK